jgi:hypothetical protein
MRWIPAFLTLVVLLVCLALGRAEAAKERPGQIDLARGAVHTRSLQADFNLVPTSTDDLSASLASLVLALPFLPATPRATLARRHRRPAAWPAATVKRFAWLQRFLF